MNPNLIQLLRQKKPFDILPRLRRARAMAHVSDLLAKLLSFEPKDRATLDLLLEHPYIKGQSFLLKFKVFIVNRALSQDLTLQVPPANYVEALLEELNTRVPPFVKGRPGASLYSAPSSSPPRAPGDSAWERPRPVLRVYLFEDGTPVHFARTLEDLMKQREIFMFHLEAPSSDVVVEDDFVLVDSADFGSGASVKPAPKTAGGALDEVNRHLVLRSKQSSALTILMRYLNVRYAETEDLEKTLSLPKLLKEERDRLKMILLVKLKDLTPKNPSASYDYFDQFWVLLAQVDQLSRKLDLIDDEKRRLVDKLLATQSSVSSLVHAVDRAHAKRDQLKKMMSSASLIDTQLAASFRDWVVDELNNKEKTREIRLLVSSIVGSLGQVDTIAATLGEMKKNLTSNASGIQTLKEAVQAALDKNRDFVPVDEAQLRVLQNTVAQLRQQVSLEGERYTSLSAEKDSLSARIDSLRTQHDTALRRVALLEDSMVERNRLARELEDSRASNAALAEEARLLAADLVAIKAANQTKDSSANESHAKQVAELNSELDDIKAQLEKLQLNSRALSKSAELSQSQEEGVVDMVLHNLDEKNKEILEKNRELEEVKRDRQDLQSKFMDEKMAKREFRSKVELLEPIKAEHSKLTTEISLLKAQLGHYERERLCVSDFKVHSLAFFVLHPLQFYYMLYEPASPGPHCWVLIDEDQQLPNVKPVFLVAELLTEPDFEGAETLTVAAGGGPHPPPGALFCRVLINPRVDLSIKLQPPQI